MKKIHTSQDAYAPRDRVALACAAADLARHCAPPGASRAALLAEVAACHASLVFLVEYGLAPARRAAAERNADATRAASS